MDKDIELILFDLGGVLVELKPSPLPAEWLPDHFQFDISDWFGSETAQRFERGEISSDEFARRLKRELDLKTSTIEIIEEFTQWPIGLYSGAHELLLDLKKSCRLAALTNTNELHWPRILHEFQLPEYFTEIFASHLMELAKPDPAVYRHVIEVLRVSPERVLFFDDNPDNVAAANELGLISHRVSSLAQIERQLVESGLLAKRALKE